jgi:anaerobic selenocysteine-containing dehydrogenase
MVIFKGWQMGGRRWIQTRGGTIAQKVYNPQTPTRDRLKSPMVRMFGVLMPVMWDFALDIAAEVGKYMLEKHGTNAYAVKTFSYGYLENTYAITKYALNHVRTANFTFHDTQSDVTSTPGFRDAGFDNFGPSYDDWKEGLLAQDYAVPEKAAEIAQIDVQKIYTSAEWMAKPKADGTRPKTSIMIEKGFYWSNNTGNTQAISSLRIVVGAGGRPGQLIGRAAGHQRGGLSDGGYRQRVGLIPFQPFPGLDPQVQLKLAVDPVDPVVVPWVPFHVAQMQKT